MKSSGKLKVGFDAKRAFFNRSGLGNYSRLILQGVIEFGSNLVDVVAFSPSPKNDEFNLRGIKRVSPKGIYKLIPTFWRSKGIVSDLKKEGVGIFHGLSNELPIGLSNAGIKSIVTIHDLIFLRYPELYKSFDRSIYLNKTKKAVKSADLIIAISEQTKQDLVEFLDVSPAKIEVVYQDCDKQFRIKKTKDEIADVIHKYSLPEHYILSVGTIEERKNQLLTLQAASGLGVSVVMIGKKTDYYNELQAYVNEVGMIDRVHFPENVSFSDFPAIYQNAKVFMYPSIFEGFGIPILEAMRSGVPVLTSKGSCFQETGGDSAIYIENDVIQAKEALSKLLSSKDLRDSCIEKGMAHSQNFDVEKTIPQLLSLYKEIAD